MYTTKRRVGLSNGPAGGLAGPHGLGHAGRAHRAGQRGLRPAAVQRRELHGRVTTGVDASGAVSCAALTATGTVAGATLSSTGAVSGSLLSITGAASVGLLSSATGITGSTPPSTTRPTPGTSPRGRRVHGHTDGLGRIRSHGGAHGRHADHHRGGLNGPAGLDCTFTATSGGVLTGSVVCGDVTRFRAAALRLNTLTVTNTVSAPQLFASTRHRDQHLRLLGRSLPDEELGGLEAASVQQQRGPRQRPELRLLGNQSARVFLERDGGAHQCKLITITTRRWCRRRASRRSTNQRNPGCLVIAATRATWSARASRTCPTAG